ncbi:hypothetical protein Ate02nite_69960 [Paractinoplanes tereljensis]|uniref:Uncharacterized protein n=1 Tax=Paractinoplanes tereljensis TaxID=571912 RepID=A0A919NUK2_9ACTN|nr:hypothetical protein Ate02nite_69960 [Actinoplanes tereljensis]
MFPGLPPGSRAGFLASGLASADSRARFRLWLAGLSRLPSGFALLSRSLPALARRAFALAFRLRLALALASGPGSPGSRADFLASGPGSPSSRPGFVASGFA